MKLLTKLKHFYWKNTIRNKSVTIISNNCWGGFMSRYCGLPYNSPFVGCFLFAPDYIALLRDLPGFMQSELKFISRNESSYADLVKEDYPIGILTSPAGDATAEIHFLHYPTPQAATEAWKRRAKRIDYSNMLVKFCDRDSCTPELIAEFDRMEFPAKVCFTAKPHPFRSVVQLSACAGMDCVEREWLLSDKHYDFVGEVDRLIARK